MPSALARIQFRFGPASDWMAANPILLEGEPGFEGDTGKVKVGDGIRHWVALPYLGSGSGSGAVTSVNAKTGAVILIPEDVPGLPAFIKSVIANTLIAGPNVGITSNTALGTVTIAAAGSSGGGGGSGSGVISINGKTGGVTVDGRDGITVTQEQSVPTIHIGVTTGGGYGGTPTFPSAPVSVVGAPGDSLVVVSWQEPAASGLSAITDYIVQYSSDYGATWAVFADGVAAALSSTVTGLTNGTDYVFRVAAVNASGQGAFSAQSASVRPFAPSSTLTGMTLSGSSVTSGNPAGTAVGLLAPVPPSIAGVTYSLPSTTPGNASFAISGNELRTTATLDSTATPTVMVSITATPSSGSSVTSDFVIAVQPDSTGTENVISITRQPAPVTTSSGLAVFGVAASSSVAEPLAYQWQSRAPGGTTWANVTGATSDTLSLTGLTYTGNNATRYRVIISSSGADSVTSNEVCLGVQPSGWKNGAPVDGAMKMFPVDSGVMVMTRKNLYWTSDSAQHEDRTPPFTGSRYQYKQFPVGWLGAWYDIDAVGWNGIGVLAGNVQPNTYFDGTLNSYRDYVIRTPDASTKLAQLKFSSSSGVGWSDSNVFSARSSFAGSLHTLTSAGPAGWLSIARVQNLYDYSYATGFSADGLATAIGISGVSVDDRWKVAVTATKGLLISPTGQCWHATVSPSVATQWSPASGTIPGGAAAVAKSGIVVEVGGSLWWFGASGSYWVSSLNLSSWTEHRLPFADNYVAVAHGNGIVVAVGSDRAAVCSDTASHMWTVEPLGLSNPVGVAFSNNKFFVYSATKSAVREALPAGGVVGCNIPGVAPSAPVQLSAVQADGAVTLSWQEPSSTGTSAVTSYSVQYRTSPAGTWSAAASVTDLVANVSGLSNGTEYDFRVCAVSSDGSSPFATATETPRGLPAEAPLSVTAVGVSPDVTALNSTLTALSVNGGYAWRHGDHTRFSVSWTPPASGPTPTRYIMEMKSIRLGKSSGFPWQPSGFASPMFRAEYSGESATVVPLYNIYNSYASATLWNRNLLWSFRVAGVTGDGPGAWSDWSVPTALMPAAASTPSNPAGGGVSTLPLPPAPVVAAGTYSTHKSCYLYGGTMQAAWWDVVTLSWPSTGSTLTGVEVQNYHNAGTVLGVSYPAGWSPLEQATAAPPSSTVYTAIANLVRTHQFFRVASPTSVELYLRRGATPCAQVAPPATSLYWSTFGTSRTLYRVILKTAGGNSPGGEVTIPIP